MIFDWQLTEAMELGIEKCAYCGGVCVISQIGNERTKKLCFEIACISCHTKRKQCTLGRYLSKDELRDRMIKHHNTRTGLNKPKEGL